MSAPAGALGRRSARDGRLAMEAARIVVRGGPLAAVLAAATLLLLAAARIPLAFEDSYHHWLIAAGFAQTGRLRDPLFGMEDTWLPGYHVIAGVVLRVTGLWQIDSLRALSAAFALGTLALLFRLAGGGRRGVISALLLALNPIFLLTATSVVAEPLLTLFVTGMAVALTEGRRRSAAALAIAACLVGTKAWLWLLLLLGVWLLAPLLKNRVPARAVSWALPALVAVVVLQLLFSFATHSLLRGAAEAGSAAARGSIGAGSFSRGSAFLGYFALASLPLLLFAPLGLARERRDPAGAARLRILHAPALLYLATVIALVSIGAYTGSHRYVYPALPALALLAAVGLDRAREGALVLAGVGALLVAVAFVPVLQSFGQLDEGLARAGRAAAPVPGGILTDSPVAAYWSGKDPSEIRGSRDIPADPDTAVTFLRAQRVGSLVLEDIGYYRINTVFPGLAGGRAIAPFIAVGAPADYSMSGGKTVSVYRIGGEVRFIRSAAGAGKTATLARGAVLELGGNALSGEGLGFGVPLLRYPEGDWFAGTRVISDLGRPGQTAWLTVYAMDRRGVAGDTSFEQASSRGSIEVTYRAVGGDLRVTVRALNINPGYTELLLMNEESAAFDDYADGRQTLLGSAVGSWTPVLGDWARFRSGTLGLEWSLPRLANAKEFHAAREVRVPDIDFSGLEYSFGPGFSGADYTIKVGEAR